jgi:glutathione S-transferase
VFGSTYADLSFVTWDMMILWIFGDEVEGLQMKKNYPAYYAWNQKLMQRLPVQTIGQDKQKAMSGK